MDVFFIVAVILALLRAFFPEAVFPEIPVPSGG